MRTNYSALLPAAICFVVVAVMAAPAQAADHSITVKIDSFTASPNEVAPDPDSSLVTITGQADQPRDNHGELVKGGPQWKLDVDVVSYSQDGQNWGTPPSGSYTPTGGLHATQNGANNNSTSGKFKFKQTGYWKLTGTAKCTYWKPQSVQDPANATDRWSGTATKTIVIHVVPGRINLTSGGGSDGKSVVKDVRAQDDSTTLEAKCIGGGTDKPTIKFYVGQSSYPFATVSGTRDAKVQYPPSLPGSPADLRFRVETDDPNFPTPPGGDGDSNGSPKSNEADGLWAKADLGVDYNDDGNVDVPEEADNSSYNETDPGAVVKFNNDDDDGDGSPDYKETTSVSNEDDLVPVILTFKPPDARGTDTIKTTVTLSATSGSSNIRIWTTSNKASGTQVTLGHPWIVGTDTIPSKVYVEGIAPGTANLELVCERDGQQVKDDVKFTVTGVELTAVPSSLAANADASVPVCFKIHGTSTVTIRSDQVTFRINGVDYSSSSSLLFEGGNWVTDSPSNPKNNGDTNLYTAFVPSSLLSTLTLSGSAHRSTRVSCTASIGYTVFPNAPDQPILHATTGKVDLKYFLDNYVRLAEIGRTNFIHVPLNPTSGMVGGCQKEAVRYHHVTNSSGQFWTYDNANGQMATSSRPHSMSSANSPTGRAFLGDATQGGVMLMTRYNNWDVDDWNNADISSGDTVREEIAGEEHGLTAAVYFGTKTVTGVGKVVDIRMYDASSMQATLFPGLTAETYIKKYHGDSGTFSPLNSALNVITISGVVLTLAQPEVDAFVVGAALAAGTKPSADIISNLVSWTQGSGTEGVLSQIYGGMVLTTPSSALNSQHWAVAKVMIHGATNDGDIGGPGSPNWRVTDASNITSGATVDHHGQMIVTQDVQAHDVINLSNFSQAMSMAYYGSFYDYGATSDLWLQYPSNTTHYDGCTFIWGNAQPQNARPNDWVKE